MEGPSSSAILIALKRLVRKNATTLLQCASGFRRLKHESAEVFAMTIARLPRLDYVMLEYTIVKSTSRLKYRLIPAVVEI